MFEEFITNQDSWLSGRGPDSGIIFSSRIRLARNLDDLPFPQRASNIQKEKVLERIKNDYTHIQKLKGGIFINMGELDKLDSQLLLERHLISQGHIGKGKGLIVTEDEEVSIMINEEDHLRMQVVTSGFNLKKCWDVLDDIDNCLSKRVSFSFLPDLGYLTACSTNVGTAMRASCMLHLPALILTKRINKILELLARISFTTRGLFGEGTQALGDFFQISNQVSLGLSEEEIIENLIGVVKQVKEQEVDSRDILLKKYRASLEDSVWRALGILKNSRLISSKECLSHLSVLSLGLDLGIIKSTDLSSSNDSQKLVNNLFVMIQPAHLQKIEGKTSKEKERDYIRAEILREKFK